MVTRSETNGNHWDERIIRGGGSIYIGIVKKFAVREYPKSLIGRSQAA